MQITLVKYDIFITYALTPVDDDEKGEVRSQEEERQLKDYLKPHSRYLCDCHSGAQDKRGTEREREKERGKNELSELVISRYCSFLFYIYTINNLLFYI